MIHKPRHRQGARPGPVRARDTSPALPGVAVLLRRWPTTSRRWLRATTRLPGVAVRGIAVLGIAALGMSACGGAGGDDRPSAVPAPVGANELPAVTVVDVVSGESLLLSSLAPANRPNLVWFWAPH